MAHNKEVVKGVEWRINVGDGSSERAGQGCIGAVTTRLAMKVYMFVKKAWEVGVNDPRKFIHCLKVGIALSMVSVFYYMKPLYDGVGGNAMWAVMTVVVVFENTAGATISKTINRICGTTLAGFLAFGVHWVASRAGEQLEPVIVGVSLFLLASAATFSRFIPIIKARFDYGAMVFILTFSLISISGYRIDELMCMAQQRIVTILIGTCLCIIVSLTICPIWAGQELHVLVTRNLDKLANSLQGCVGQYFSHSEATSDEESKKLLLGYKCVQSSKATEDVMANLARWEPAHGRFNFRHPWKQYLKIAASMRTCASCIDALIGCINTENKAPEHIKKNMSSISLKVGAQCANVIRELAITMRNMTKSSKIDILVTEMNNDAQELRDLLKSYPNLINPSSSSHNAQETQTEVVANMEIPLMEIIQVVTIASLLIEIVARVKCIVKGVEELSDLAKFQPATCVKSKQHTMDNKISPEEEKDEGAINKLQIV
ncbi:hypothetical protein RIF29_21742 [Crotalaria pallida]|uniref:Aluminum-activated malate transporter n=1 Tax=Crotalaria pallida TaxID=3830 RepID=A0AAN9F376_CROPI